MGISDIVMKKAIRQQKRIIKNSGYEPTWGLFSNTFGWFQIKKKYELTEEEQLKYKQIWENTK